MLVHIGADHRGYELKRFLCDFMSESCISYVDIGCFSDDICDYPDFAAKLAHDIEELGVLICNTGIGMSIAGNSHSNLAAALCMNEDMASSARAHNNANVLVLPSKYLSKEAASRILTIFIRTDFDYATKSINRLKKINKTY